MRPMISMICFLVGAPALADTPRVMTDIAPVQSLVAQVMDGIGTPDLLLTGGEDPHSFQMKPSQARNLAQADILIWVGPTLTPWLARASNSLSGNGHNLALLDEHDSHAHDDHDPHAWLDPDIAQLWLDRISAELGEVDPANAATYAANAQQAKTEITALTAKLEVALTEAQNQPIVVLHDAYDAYADRFGLLIAGALREGDAAAAGAAHVAALRDIIVDQNVTCVFSEPLHDDSLLLAVIDGTYARVGELDPLGSTLPPGPALYEQLLQAMADEIIRCLNDAN